MTASVAVASADDAVHAALTGARVPVDWVRDDRYLTPLRLMVWALIVLMTAPEGFDYTALDAAGAPNSGGIVSRLAWLALLGAGLVVVIRRIRFTRLLLAWLNPFLLLFALLALASVAWSIDPLVTARRLLRIAAIVSASTAFAVMGWHPRRFQEVLRPIITGVLLGSLLFGMAWPELAIHQESSGVLAHAWHGLCSHKNGLGDIACVGLIFWYHAWLCREVRWLPAALGAAAAVACLLLSRSSTALVGAGFALAFLTLLLRSPHELRRFLPSLVAVFVAALLAYSIAIIDIIPGSQTLLAPISAFTGKDTSFTGRTVIWDIVAQHILLHPWLGTGYGAYWTGPVLGTDSFEFIRLLHFYPGSAHNGYLDQLNDLGVAGLVVLAGYLGLYLRQCLQLLRVDRPLASLYLALFLQQAIANLSESHWLSAFSVDFVIMTLATTTLARALLDRHLRARAAAGTEFARRGLA